MTKGCILCVLHQICVISWRLLLLEGETEVFGENHRRVATNWQVLPAAEHWQLTVTGTDRRKLYISCDYYIYYVNI